ncbi:MAG: SDR family NAD(P)-dependent oxidoreductase [Planctomycetota bacterium]|nr:SDR family NAD(P)-dependent oxidoreductase [Planctomycetota bacterium]
MQIAGHTFLITGGASGLGAGCVRRFAADGANVIIADLNEVTGTALASESCPSVRFVKTDITQTADIQHAIELAVQAFGSLHGLINCAGVLHAARVVGREGPYDLDQFRRVIEINLIGTFNAMRLSASAMAGNTPNEEGERGVVINTSSVSAYDGQIGQASYSASKGAVAAMTLPVARELAKLGIRIVAIAPGVFDTAMMAGVSDEQRQGLSAQVPFPPRLGKPSEFASLACQIVENPMLNGSVIRLDGALRMGAK